MSIRAGEADAFLAATETGHGGVMATIHAATPEAALAAFDDVAAAFEAERPVLVCEQFMRTFAQVVELAGHSYKAMTDAIAMGFGRGRTRKRPQ